MPVFVLLSAASWNPSANKNFSIKNFLNILSDFAMVDYIKPGLLGTAKQFGYYYSGPIRAGQHADSSPEEIKLMKQKSFILHKKLSNFIQRKEVSILRTFLPVKFEYVLSIPLTDLQYNLYEQLSKERKKDNILVDYTNFRKIWTHPKVLEKASQNSKFYALAKRRKQMKTEQPPPAATIEWWKNKITNSELNSVLSSNKIMVLFEILRLCNESGDKLLIFSSYVAVLNMVEDFLQKLHWKDPMMTRFMCKICF